MLDHRYRLKMEENVSVLLISAIANTDYLLEHLHRQSPHVQTLDYEDHHYFDRRDLGNLKLRFDEMPGKHKAIITTEKDATRLELHRDYIVKEQLPIFVLPLAVRFHFGEGPEFDTLVRDYLLEFKA